jgi:hypothetical protein
MPHETQSFDWSLLVMLVLLIGAIVTLMAALA